MFVSFIIIFGTLSFPMQVWSPNDILIGLAVLQDSLVCRTDRHTNTDHATARIAIAHILYYVLRCGIIIRSETKHFTDCIFQYIIIAYYQVQLTFVCVQDSICSEAW